MGDVYYCFGVYDKSELGPNFSKVFFVQLSIEDALKASYECRTANPAYTSTRKRLTSMSPSDCHVMDVSNSENWVEGEINLLKLYASIRSSKEGFMEYAAHGNGGSIESIKAELESYYDYYHSS